MHTRDVASWIIAIVYALGIPIPASAREPVSTSGICAPAFRNLISSEFMLHCKGLYATRFGSLSVARFCFSNIRFRTVSRHAGPQWMCLSIALYSRHANFCSDTWYIAWKAVIVLYLILILHFCQDFLQALNHAKPMIPITIVWNRSRFWVL